MDLAALRRAFRARPGTALALEFVMFLEGLESSEPDWRSFVSILERDVVPVVSRCHPATEPEEVSSTCLTGAFERWVSEWRDGVRAVTSARDLLTAEQYDEAFSALSEHMRFRGQRAEKARALWNSRCFHDAVKLIEGSRSARSHFIARARDQIGESQRKLRRQSRLISRHCRDASGISAGQGHRMATKATRQLCGAEIECATGERSTWRISALPPAHLMSQDLADRLGQMLGAIEALGPDHSRVFKLLLEGLSQRSIAKVEGRHPAAISRRVRNLQELCRVQLLE